MITSMDIRETLATIREEFPGFRLVRKPGSGRCGPTIGQWFFISSSWATYSPLRQYEILRHEWVHLRQYRRCGFGSSWLGVVPFLVAYLFFPVPMGLAWCRYRWERAAFVESMRVVAEEQGPAVLRAKRDFYVGQFTGRAYGWCWPWRHSVTRWVEGVMAQVILETQQHGV